MTQRFPFNPFSFFPPQSFMSSFRSGLPESVSPPGQKTSHRINRVVIDLRLYVHWDSYYELV